VKGLYIDLADVGTTREVMANEPPRGVRILILASAAVLAVLTALLGWLPVQQARQLDGVIVADSPQRTVVAGRAGVVSAALVRTGGVVAPGQVLLRLDSAPEQRRLDGIRSEEQDIAAELEGKRQLRDAAKGEGNPFDSDRQPDLYYAMEQYRQRLRTAEDAVGRQERAESAARASAEAVLTQNESTLAKLASRRDALSALAASVRWGGAFSSADEYCLALQQSYMAGRPRPDAAPLLGGVQSTAEYDAAFLVQVESQINDLETQRAGYESEVARLRSELARPAGAAADDPAIAVQADFMLSLSVSEQQLHERQVSLALEAMAVELEIREADVVSPAAGVAELIEDWGAGDRVQVGQDLFHVVPPSGASSVRAAVPAALVPVLQVGQDLPCAIPDGVSGRSLDTNCRVDEVSAGYGTTQDNEIYYAARLRVSGGVGSREDSSQLLRTGLPVRVSVPVREVSALRWIGERIGLLESR
jgi:multidrug efflux pump subunit AcrA (membrane-fusion protein)